MKSRLATAAASAAVAVLLATGTGRSLADDWPNWRGPKLDRISAEKDWDPEKLDNTRWTAKVGIGFASISVSKGRLYAIGHNGTKGESGQETIYCLDARSGKEIWKTSYDARLLPNLHEGGPSATPTIHAGKVYTLSKDGRLRCSGADTGKPQWERDLLEESGMEEPAEWGFASSPLIVDDKLIVEAAQTLAFDRDTGKPIWKSERYQPAYGTPTPFLSGGRTCLATVKSDGLVILDADDGKTLAFEEWETRFDTNANTPIVSGDLIFISTGYQRGCALYRFTGNALGQVYANKEMSNHMSGCVLIGGQLYGFDGNTHTGRTRQLRCLDFATGKVRWTQAGFGIGAISAAGGRLIILGEKGEMVIADASPEKFSPLSRAQVSSGRHWNVPVLANGFLYVRNAAGKLVAIDLNE